MNPKRRTRSARFPTHDDRGQRRASNPWALLNARALAWHAGVDDFVEARVVACIRIVESGGRRRGLGAGKRDERGKRRGIGMVLTDEHRQSDADAHHRERREGVSHHHGEKRHADCVCNQGDSVIFQRQGIREKTAQQFAHPGLCEYATEHCEQ